MQITQEKIDLIVKRAIRFGAKKVILFGSAAEDPDHAHDIDIACDIKGWQIFTFAGEIEDDLNNLFCEGANPGVPVLFPAGRRQGFSELWRFRHYVHYG